MDKRRVYISSVLVMLGIAVCVWTTIKPGEKKVVIESEESSSSVAASDEETAQTKRIFPVYIGGAVNKPGVYQIENEIYLYLLIDLAGGFSEEADTEYIDRVYLIDHPQSIHIPRVGEISDKGESVPTLGDISVDGSGNNSGEEKTDINHAGVSELCQLPGIGTKTAERILSYRETNGRFEKKEDIMKVSGIGESKYEKIKDLIFAG